MVRFIRHLVALHGNDTAWSLAPRCGGRLTLGLLAGIAAAAGGCSGAADGGEVAAEISEYGDSQFDALEVASKPLTDSADTSKELLAVFDSVRNGCPMVGQRKELRELSTAERGAFRSALLQVIHDTSSPLSYDALVKIHADNASFVHGQPMYLPFHRAYLRLLEYRLQRVNPRVVLPYWDFVRDTAMDMRSLDLGDGLLGCVPLRDDLPWWTDNPFLPWTPKFPTPHCLQRWAGAGFGIYFPSREIAAPIIEASPGYEDLWEHLEWLAWTPKSRIGGDMKSRLSAPNDPFYWLSMAFIDKIWADWQQTSGKPTDYNGTDSDGTPASLIDPVVPFPVNVQNVMSTRNLCYTY